MPVISALRLLTRFALLVVLLQTSLGHAQQSLNDVLNSTEDKARLKVLEQVILDRMIIPGKGINVAAIGTNIAALTRTLGEPIKQSEKGIRNKTYHRQYSLDDGTQLVVTGKDVIQSLNFIGSQASSYMTSEGITFGLASARVAIVYGAGAVTESALVYDNLGIAFRFSNNALAEILIAQPGALSEAE